MVCTGYLVDFGWLKILNFQLSTKMSNYEGFEAYQQRRLTVDTVLKSTVLERPKI
jgi:hypothetical protein